MFKFLIRTVFNYFLIYIQMARQAASIREKRTLDRAGNGESGEQHAGTRPQTNSSDLWTQIPSKMIVTIIIKFWSTRHFENNLIKKMTAEQCKNIWTMNLSLWSDFLKNMHHIKLFQPSY